MEIEVGEYVRTIHGEIAIFRGWNNNPKSQWSCKLEFQKNKTWKYCCEEYIKSHSPDIIGLVEVGDFVNGEFVMCVDEAIEKYGTKTIITECNNRYFGSQIISIVTKEQFKGMEYKLYE